MIILLGLGIYFLLMGVIQPELGTRQWWYIVTAGILIALGVNSIITRLERRSVKR